MSSLTRPLLATNQGTTLLNVKLTVLALVVLFHGLVLFSWHKPHIQPVMSISDMTVSFAQIGYVTPANIIVQHKTVPVSEPLLEKIPQQQPARIEQQAETNSIPAVASSATLKEESEPVYKASYLNNHSPVYPLAARRMGLQGRVVLQVEVLAAGRCGGISIQTSSGYAMLDNAALEAVKSWRFIPARQAGNAVDKWFIIPVQFSLKDNA